MTTLYIDDTTGKEYNLKSTLHRACLDGYDCVDFHPIDFDEDELREQLHEIVDAYVDTQVEAREEEA